MLTFKQRCIQLRKRGFSLPQIVHTTGRSKTSIYFHIRDIPLSKERLAEINKRNRAWWIRYNHARAGISKREFKIFSRWTKTTVSLVAHLLFDGEITRASCIYNNRSNALIVHVRNCMKEIYSYEPKEWLNRNSGVMRISYHNVAFALYIKNKSQQLLAEIPNLSRELQRVFLRASFDDEGCIYFRPRKKSRLVRGYQYKPDILRLIHSLLKNFDIESKLQIRHNEISISKRKNIENFAKEINFTAGVCVNGARKNSIWKQSLEKRDILQKALASYQK